ncbi:MAG: cytochrome c biogenesis protein CcsA [Verrucomicrobiae bacterium]|nr:cytochrome c biogenesis protein CcsA [Verrucomicrobiae bacterium]
MKSILHQILGATLVCASVACLSIPSTASAKDVSVSFEKYDEWPEEVPDIFREILVQEGGRVKPVHTYARFMLLQFSGHSNLRFETAGGTEYKIEAVAWLLDTFFRPELAADMPIFSVDDSETVLRLGIEPKEKRDLYSYNDLLPGRAKLAELAGEYGRKKQEHEESDKDPRFELDRIENMILVLGQNISNFEYLMGQFGFARKGESLTHESVLPDELRELAKRLDMTEMLDRMPEMSMSQLMQALQAPGGSSDEEQMLRSAMQLFFFHANSGRGFAVFPPKDKEDEAWLSIGDVMLAGLQSKEDRPWAIERMNEIRGLVEASREEGGAFAEALKTFHEKRQAEVKERGKGEGERSGLEVKLYEGDYFFYSLVCFILSFVVMALSWLAPGTKYAKYLTWGVVACLVIGLGYNVIGITMRCMIRHRPPVTNLYETVLFITGVAVFLALIVERITKMGVGIFLASLVGVVGMFLSIKYEAKEATDTMPQLVAVLDTNFWLATHVIIINIGYASGMLSAVFGIFYLLGRNLTSLSGSFLLPLKIAFGFLSMTFFFLPFTLIAWRLLGIWGLLFAPPVLALFVWRTLKTEDPKSFFREVTRMNYGIICFCLVFSLIGTVLGGIWANYSWGRFWGWDPKENGALMICLWTLVILHGRMGGYIREIGLNVNSIILGILVTFSWWGVNNLGVGLHSYGFTSGIWRWLAISWLIAVGIMLCGLPLWLQERADRERKKLEKEKGKKKLTKAGGDEAPSPA